MKIRSIISLATLAVILVVINVSIAQKEDTVRNGHTVLLELGTRDPRSLMQGDYMVLRYRLAQDMPLTREELSWGRIVISLDENDVARFERFHEGGELRKGELLLEFKRTGNRWGRNISFGAREFFFEEGTADTYSQARYGELRVNEEGEAVLVGLRDENFEILGQRVLSPDAKGIFVH